MKRPLVPLFLSLASGILVSHIFIHIQLPYYILLLLVLLLISTIPYLSDIQRDICICILFFISGVIFEQNEHITKSRLISYATKKQDIIIEGVILEPPRIIKNMARFRLRADRIFERERVYPVREDMMVYIYKYYLRLEVGDRIRFPCRIKEFRNFYNPGAFNYKEFMRIRGITCKAYIRDGRYVVFMGKGKLSFPYNLIESLRRPIRDFFKKELKPSDFAIFSAIILGERQNLDEEIKEAINKAGLGHILAVSGLHIGLVAWLSFFVIRAVLLRSYRLTLAFDIRKLSAILTFIPVIGYALISGFRVPTQRAMIMILVFLFSIISENEDDILSSLCLAGLIILAIHPSSLFSASFQLSFMAVAGIIWIMPRIKGFFMEFIKEREHLNNKITFYFIDLISVTISATISLLPFILYYFHRFPLVSILANITVIPILGLWVLPTALISICFLPFSYKIANILLQISTLGMHNMLSIIKMWANIPYSSIWLFTPNILEIGLYYALLSLLFHQDAIPHARIWILILCLIFISDTIYWLYRIRFNKELRITFLDAGRGKCTFVEFPMGKKMVIDGGGFSKNFRPAKMILAPFLWYSKIMKIDYIAFIPGKKGYMKDLDFIIRVFHAKRLNKIPKMINGVEIEQDNVRPMLRILYNDVSISFLENLIKVYGSDDKSDINMCIILGSDNKSIDLKKAGFKVYSTYRDGAIQLIIKDGIKIKTYKEGDHGI